jgi:hypothetical protein
MTVRGGVLTYTGSLIVETCPDCGTAHAIPQGLRDHALRDHSVSVYCPLGHTWHYIGETAEAKEKRLRKWAEDQAASERARADRAEASRRAWKGQTTRLRNRAAEGECVFCGKFFVGLAVHTAKVHPGEHPRELEEADARGPVA